MTQHFVLLFLISAFPDQHGRLQPHAGRVGVPPERPLCLQAGGVQRVFQRMRECRARIRRGARGCHAAYRVPAAPTR